MTKKIRTDLQKFVRDMRKHFREQFSVVEIDSYDDGVRVKTDGGVKTSIIHATIKVALSDAKEGT